MPHRWLTTSAGPLLLGALALAVPGWAAVVTALSPSTEPACTAEVIGADTSLILRPDIVCSAGFAMGLLAPGDATADAASTTTATDGCSRTDQCPAAEIFHLTTSGWVHDGLHPRDCAENIGVLFMAPHTAASFAPLCNPATLPAPALVQLDDASPAVMSVQIALVAAGYQVFVDGTFDGATDAAVQSFQEANALPVTGVVDPATHALLGTGPNPQLPPPTSTTLAPTTTAATTTTVTPSAITPGPARSCDAATIGADTGLSVRSVRACVAGWAQGMVSTTCAGTDPEAECEDADVFHVTEDGWVHDGVMYAYCANALAESSGMSIYTAMEITYLCAGAVPPARTNIEPGSSGPRVTHAQIALIALGYPLAVDGEYGPDTEGAVRDYQQRNGLEVDGIAGPRTQDALRI